MKSRGGRLLALSADPPHRAAQVVQRHELPFPILSDSERRVIGAFGVLHAGGAPDGGDIAIPSHFLIDRDGRIVWRFIASRVQNRPDPAELLRVIRALPR